MLTAHMLSLKPDKHQRQFHNIDFIFPLIFLGSAHCDTGFRLIFPADIPYIYLQSPILMLNVDMIHYDIPF